MVVDKKTGRVMCTAFSNGKCHDFNLFKTSCLLIHPDSNIVVDSGYQGMQNLHAKCEIPKKKSKKNPLTKEDKRKNREISSKRVKNENAIGFLKRFKILSERYRNRRKRFGLRFNLIAGICNFEIE